MAQERKAGDNGPPWAKMRSVVPPTKKDDIEDVAWALQTAEATWSRGDYADALKWIRRAAEAASEAEADDRALELAKAAADVASLLADRPTAVAPPPPPPLPPTPEPPKLAAVAKAPPPPAAPPSVTVSAGRITAAGPTPIKVPTNQPSLPRQDEKAPVTARMQPGVGAKRGGRRSAPALIEEVTRTGIEVSRGRRASVTSEAKKRGRLSKPSPDETAQNGPITSRHPSMEDAEAWPTASLTGDEFEDDSQYTRVGTPAYHEGAQRASARPAAMPIALAPLVMSQAVRVVVWRAADGVHVAPAGTQVTAIGVEAILVALDPSADLAAWLSNK